MDADEIISKSVIGELENGGPIGNFTDKWTKTGLGKATQPGKRLKEARPSRNGKNIPWKFHTTWATTQMDARPQTLENNIYGKAQPN